MAEQGNAVIYIGGKLKRSLLTEFMNTVEDTGGGPEWGLTYSRENLYSEEALLQVVTAENGHFVVRDNTARNMEFEGLEEWLKENKLPFDRHGDANYEYDAIWVFYRPGVTDGHFEKMFTVMSDQQDGKYLDAEGVLAARRALANGNAHEALKALDNTLKGYERILPLEKFEIVDG